MKDEDIRKLLGGYATDSLTSEEREALYTAALQNQELFDALADEEALHELLSDPVVRRQLLALLGPERRPGLIGHVWAWMRRPAPLVLAATVMTTLVVTVVVRQANHKPLREVALRREPLAIPAATGAETSSAPKPAPPLADAVKPAERRMLAMKKEAAERDRRAAAAEAPGAQPALPPAPPARLQTAVVASEVNRQLPQQKLKVALLDLDAQQAQSKDANKKDENAGGAASDLLARKLDSTGAYSVIDRKEVDKALVAQNLVNRPLDAPSAARVGQSLGADAVILSQVTEAPALTTGRLGANAGFRGSAPRAAKRAKAAPAPAPAPSLQQPVAVTLTAINPKTAGNLAVATGQNVDQAVQSLQQQLQPPRIDGLVTDVNATILTVNTGARDGLKPGDRLEVRRDGKRIGEVTLSTVKDVFSVGRFSGTDAPKAGDAVTNH